MDSCGLLRNSEHDPTPSFECETTISCAGEAGATAVSRLVNDAGMFGYVGGVADGTASVQKGISVSQNSSSIPKVRRDWNGNIASGRGDGQGGRGSNSVVHQRSHTYSDGCNPLQYHLFSRLAMSSEDLGARGQSGCEALDTQTLGSL